MSQTKTYTGSCHCGQVRYEVALDLGAPVISCNCSICGRSGTLLQFVAADQFKVLSGADHLKDYLFNRHVIHHVFCDVCGIKPFARGKNPDGSDMVAVNVRCIDDVDLAALTVKNHDGKNR